MKTTSLSISYLRRCSLDSLFGFGSALVSIHQHHKPSARHASTLTPVTHNALAHTKLGGKFSNATSNRDCMFKFVHAPIITYVFECVNTNELSQW